MSLFLQNDNNFNIQNENGYFDKFNNFCSMYYFKLFSIDIYYNIALKCYKKYLSHFYF